MKNPLKQLAGETAMYGLSTILARLINVLFVPFYTRLLSTEQYGISTEFLSYIAILQVILVLGLETGCFRFANKEGVDAKAVFSNAFTAVFVLNLAFFACLTVFSSYLAVMLGYDDYASVIVYVGGILALDNTTAILFAKLRQEHRAGKFVVLKTVKILTETAFNIYLFFPFVSRCSAMASTLGKSVGALTGADVWLLHFVSATPDFSYPIFAVFASSVLCAVLFVPEVLRLSFAVDKKLLRTLLGYSLPLMVAALPGIVNDLVDRILFRYWDTSAQVWQSSLGIFQASVKLAVIMNLFIQMFRFAAEPFFFQRAKDKNSLGLYADVMEYFTAFCGLIFLGVILYIDVFSLILGNDFRSGIGVVPVMLLSYMILGMLLNVNMWYKLSEKTDLAVVITLSGLAVTILVNFLFMPRYSYWAAAFGHLASYVLMFVISAVLGCKYYPIPYKWGKIGLVFLAMGVLYGLTLITDNWIFEGGIDFRTSTVSRIAGMLLLHTVYMLLYMGFCFFLFKKSRGGETKKQTD